MNIRPINNEKDYNIALKRMEKLWGSKSGTPEGDELEVLAILVDKFEEVHYPIEAPDAVEAIKYLMEEHGLDRYEISKAIGDKSKVSEILNRKRSLSKRMIKSLHEMFDIPYEVLMAKV